MLDEGIDERKEYPILGDKGEKLIIGECPQVGQETVVEEKVDDDQLVLLYPHRSIPRPKSTSTDVVVVGRVFAVMRSGLRTRS